MSELTSPSQNHTSSPTTGLEEATSYLTGEFSKWKSCFDDQPALTQRFLEAQGRKLADSLTHQTTQVRFSLPDKVIISTPQASGERTQTLPVPTGLREQAVVGLIERIRKKKTDFLLRQRLDELESHVEPSVEVSAGLIRYATAFQMVHNMLPAGRTVVYEAAPDEEIPTIPVVDDLEPSSAITATTDVVVEADQEASEEGRGELIVPYVPAARHFYLPQWVAFDDQDHLLVNTVSEAEAHIASMQRFVQALHAAVSLAPYIIADPEYQQKRYGILGQLVNQGRALARYQTHEIIRTIQHRAAAQSLNRGLSLSLPYFDDQDLNIQSLNFNVIPAGRIMFVPAFVVLASRKEQVKVAQDTRLGPSTRKHILDELCTLEQGFESEILLNKNLDNVGKYVVFDLTVDCNCLSFL
jgi:hypothetical protein